VGYHIAHCLQNEWQEFFLENFFFVHGFAGIFIDEFIEQDYLKYIMKRNAAEKFCKAFLTYEMQI